MMAVLVSKQGNWNVVPGGTSGTPTLTIPNVLEGALIQVTVEFHANTGADGGFYYAVQTPQIPGSMSAAQRAISGVDGWQNVSMTSFWKHAPGNGSVEDVTFELDITTGGFSKHGQIGQFLIFADIARFT